MKFFKLKIEAYPLQQLGHLGLGALLVVLGAIGLVSSVIPGLLLIVLRTSVLGVHLVLKGARKLAKKGR